MVFKHTCLSLRIISMLIRCETIFTPVWFKEWTQHLFSLQCFHSKGKLQRSGLNFTYIINFSVFLHLPEISLSEDGLFSLFPSKMTRKYIFETGFLCFARCFPVFIWPFWVVLSYLVCSVAWELLLSVLFPVSDGDKKHLRICYTRRWNVWDYLLPNPDSISLD